MSLLRTASLIVHAGDVTGVDALAELEGYAPVVAVHGNMDSPELRERLPEARVVEVEGARIGVVHEPGPVAGRPERLRRLFPDCDAIAYGHTHLPEVSRHDGVWILNPGSPTERRRAPWRSLLLLEIAGGRIEPRLVQLP